jgi:hypothetical protein
MTVHDLLDQNCRLIAVVADVSIKIPYSIIGSSGGLEVVGLVHRLHGVPHIKDNFL